jgi:hypothetical protein
MVPVRTATQDQREMAALLYAGRRSLLTGAGRDARHRLRPAGPDLVDVLIPWERRGSAGRVASRRSRRFRGRVGQPSITAVPQAA